MAYYNNIRLSNRSSIFFNKCRIRNLNITNSILNRCKTIDSLVYCSVDFCYETDKLLSEQTVSTHSYGEFKNNLDP